MTFTTSNADCKHIMLFYIIGLNLYHKPSFLHNRNFNSFHVDTIEFSHLKVKHSEFEGFVLPLCLLFFLKFIIALGYLIWLEFVMCQRKWVSGRWAHLVLCWFPWDLQFCVASPVRFSYIATHCALSHFAALGPALQALPSSVICSPLQHLMAFVSGNSNLWIPWTPSVNSDITS